MNPLLVVTLASIVIRLSGLSYVHLVFLSTLPIIKCVLSESKSSVFYYSEKVHLVHLHPQNQIQGKS